MSHAAADRPVPSHTAPSQPLLDTVGDTSTRLESARRRPRWWLHTVSDPVGGMESGRDRSHDLEAAVAVQATP